MTSMTDNRTTELLPCPFCGGKAWMGVNTESTVREYFIGCLNCHIRLYKIGYKRFYTEAEAIAAWNARASERHPYEQRITGDGENWGEVMADAFDSLMASASESCTAEEFDAFESHIAATLGGGKLTAEQVREAIACNSWQETSMLFEFNDSSWQAIADELNARAERTCEVNDCDSGEMDIDVYALSCGHVAYYPSVYESVPSYCPECGARVVE